MNLLPGQGINFAARLFRDSMIDLAHARDRMVDVQIARRGARDRHVLEAMRRVPREAFVEPGYEEFAYEDNPLPIGEGQTISQPYIVGSMIEGAEVKPGETVLEVGGVQDMRQRSSVRLPTKCTPSNAIHR
jgi:Protein-L-isoaspartate(D-aspartate) O-methyltransferase (PCMT)